MSVLATKLQPSRMDRARDLFTSGFKWTLFWTAILFIALFSSFFVATFPIFAAVPAALALSWLICRKWPVAGFTGLFILSGGFWSIEVFLKIPTGPAADVILIGLWIACIAALIKEDAPGVKRLWPGAIGLALFCFLMFLFIFRADDALPALYAWRLSFWYMLGALMLAYAPMPRGALWRLTRAALVVAFLVAAYALFRWVVGPTEAESSYVNQAGAGYEEINGEVRLFGSMGAGHFLSSWMSPVIVFTFALVLGVRGKWRIFALIVCGMSAAALVGTHVRAGEATAAIGIAFVIFVAIAAQSLGPRRFAAIGLATIIGLAGVAFIISNQAGKGTEKSKRFEAILNPENDYSFQARKFKWETVLAELPHKPIGDGLGTSGNAEAKYGRFITISTSEVDNSYLSLALQVGLALMLVFAFVLILLLVGLTKGAITGTDPLGATIALASAGALVAYMIECGFGIYIEGINSMGIWMFLGLGFRAISRREPAAAEPATA